MYSVSLDDVEQNEIFQVEIESSAWRICLVSGGRAVNCNKISFDNEAGRHNEEEISRGHDVLIYDASEQETTLARKFYKTPNNFYSD